VPDPHLVRRLFTDGAPHLVAWAGEGIGVVGPLVVPGRSSCLHCVDLHKTTSEPAWPTLATQLAGRPQPADLASAQASAAFAVSQALRVLDGPRHAGKRLPADPTDLPVWDAAVEIDTYTGETRRTNWPKHPYCTCSSGEHNSEEVLIG
jgi:bacteriocin biosynthesis cyclodehydratase domain-containing protein